MLKTIKDFFLNLFSPSLEIEKPFEYPRFDSHNLKKELQIEKKGKEDGKANIPPKSAKEVIGYEVTIINNLKKKITEQESRASKEISLLSEGINNLEIGENKQKLDNYDKETADVFSSLRKSAANFKHYEEESVHDINSQFKIFKSKNNLDRVATYPNSKRFNYSIIIAIVLFEIIINAGFFIDYTKNGLIGGMGVSALIAVVNIGFGVAFGELVWRYKNHTNYLLKLISYFGLVIYLFVIVFINFSVGHFRDLVNSSSDQESINQFFLILERVRENAFIFDSFSSMFIVPIGIFFSLLAMYEAYTSDDKYPRYGKIDRERKNLTQKHYKDIISFLSSSNQTMKDRKQEILDIFKIISYKHDTLENYRIRINRYIKDFNIFLKQIEIITEEIVNEYRDINMKNRTKPSSYPSYYYSTYILDYKPKISFPEKKINEYLTHLEELKNQSEKISKEKIRNIDDEYLKTKNLFKDIKEIENYLIDN